MIEVSQIRQPGLFRSTHYVVTQGQGGSLQWTLTGLVGPIPFTIPDGHAFRKDKLSISLTLPGIGDKWVRVSQWAPFVSGVSTFQLVEPQNPMPMAVIECNVERSLEATPPFVRGGPVNTLVLELGYVVHLIGSLVAPSGPR